MFATTPHRHLRVNPGQLVGVHRVLVCRNRPAARQFSRLGDDQIANEDTRIEAAQSADYSDILKDCPETYSKERFYQHMTKASWSYGELFQGIGNCHPGYGKTTFDIRLVDIGETFSKGQFDRPCLINAASLDAVFQSWLGATYNNGAFEVDKPFVPTSIGELEISVDLPADADSVMPGLRGAGRYGFIELSADIVCFDTEISKVFLSVKNFRTSELDMDAGKPNGESVEVDPADITSEVQWNHALSVLQHEEISQVVSVVPTQERLTEVSSESYIFLPFPSAPSLSTRQDKIDIIADMECSLFAWCFTIIRRRPSSS